MARRLRGEVEPQTPPRRARWRAERSEGTPIALQSPVGLARGASNDQVWTNTGTSLAQRPNGRGAAGYRPTARSLSQVSPRRRRPEGRTSGGAKAARVVRLFFLCRFESRETAPSRSLSISLSLSLLKRGEVEDEDGSTHDPTPRRLLTPSTTIFNPFSMPMARGEYPPIAKQLPEGAATRGGVCVGWVSQPVIKPALILLPPPAPW